MIQSPSSVKMRGSDRAPFAIYTDGAGPLKRRPSHVFSRCRRVGVRCGPVAASTLWSPLSDLRQQLWSSPLVAAIVSNRRPGVAIERCESARLSAPSVYFIISGTWIGGDSFPSTTGPARCFCLIG